MENWNETDFSEQTRPRSDRAGGSWCRILTVLSLVLGFGLTIILSFLTKDVQNRPIWMMGLIFTVPIAGVMFAGFLVDKAGNVMTPPTSRASQLRVTAITLAAVFLLASLCDGIYLYGGFSADAADDIEFLIYEYGHDGGSSVDTASVHVIRHLKEQTRGRANAGVYLFDWDQQNSGDVHSYVPIGRLDDQQMEKIEQMLLYGVSQSPTSFGLSKACNEVEQFNSGRRTRIFIMTIHSSVSYSNSENELHQLIDRLNRAGCSVYLMGTEATNAKVLELIEKTGGKMITDFSEDSIEDVLVRNAIQDGDILRADTASAILLSGIMMLLIGLAAGFGLMIMLSVQGQKRVQVLLSPLLAILGFVVLRFLKLPLPGWLLEGVCLGLISIVIMRTNNTAGRRPVSVPDLSEETDFQENSSGEW